MARRTLILVVVGLVAAAGCFGGGAPPPPRPTQLCGLGFNRASDYQDDYFGLGHADTGWVTADGFVPSTLPDGRVAWWMSDTMTGSVGGGNSVPNPVNVHNSIVEQGGGCLTPHLAAIPYSPNVWYWPGSAVVTGNTLQVFSYKVRPASGPPGFDWQVVGTSVTRFSLPGLQLVGGPTDLPTNTNLTGETIPWGVRSFFSADENKVYLYGTTVHPTDFVPEAKAWVARAPVDQLTDQSKWEFFTDSTVALPDCPTLPPPLPPWSTKFACARPMEFQKSDGSAVGSPLAQLSAVPYGDSYLAGAFIWDTITPDIGAWIAQSPSGPWVQQPSNAATFHPRDRQIAYDARIADLPGPGWTVVYSENDPYNQNGDFTLYRGEFAKPNGLPAP